MTFHVIASVGTSIFSNHQNSDAGCRDCKLKPAKTLSQNEYGQSLVMPQPHEFAGCDHVKALTRENFRDFCLDKGEQKNGAEEDTIVPALERQDPKRTIKDCTFHLITTDSAKSMFCASFLQHFVLQTAEVNVYVPRHLGAANDTDFAGRGMQNMMGIVSRLLLRAREHGEETILIPTGGFKATTPYLTLMSVLYGVPAYYLHDEARTLLELPAPPLSVDAAEFRVRLPLLQNIEDMTEAEASVFKDALPASFQYLIEKDAERDRYAITPFGRRLSDLFQQQPGSLVQTRASRSGLMKHLSDTDRKRFDELTRLGDSIWIGDKAPEMADHARHHHSNLFAYAELLLLPILDHHKNLLTSRELFTLMCTILLHDCGHSRADLEGTPLLPTEIRNYHNILGQKRLQDAGFKKLLESQGLDMETLKPDLDTVALLTAYHRKKMPLTSPRKPQPCPDGTPYPPLQDRDNGERLILLEALFRIIDGMDKQVSRAGDAVEITMKAAAIRADLEHIFKQADALGACLNGLYPKVFGICNRILERVMLDFGMREQMGASDSKEKDPCHYPEIMAEANTCYRVLGDELAKFDGGTQLQPLAWQYMLARTRFFFNALQPNYHYSDLLLNPPKVRAERQDQGLHITIAYHDYDDPAETREKLERIWRDIQETVEKLCSDTKNRCHPKTFAMERSHVKNKDLTDARSAAESVRKEYINDDTQEVKEILARHGIHFTFKHNDEPV